MGEALDGNQGDNIETKGVKAHFQLDDSGILTCTSVESVFEKTVSVEEQEKKEKEWKEATDGIDWSKLGDNIKSFFGTDDQKPEGGSEDEKKDDEQKESADEKKEEKKTDEKEKKGKDKKEKDTKKEKDKKKEEPKKPKVEN